MMIMAAKLADMLESNISIFRSLDDIEIGKGAYYWSCMQSDFKVLRETWGDLDKLIEGIGEGMPYREDLSNKVICMNAHTGFAGFLLQVPGGVDKGLWLILPRSITKGRIVTVVAGKDLTIACDVKVNKRWHRINVSTISQKAKELLVNKTGKCNHVDISYTYTELDPIGLPAIEYAHIDRGSKNIFRDIQVAVPCFSLSLKIPFVDKPVSIQF